MTRIPPEAWIVAACFAGSLLIAVAGVAAEYFDLNVWAWACEDFGGTV
jgi:hypothetical protein